MQFKEPNVGLQFATAKKARGTGPAFLLFASALCVAMSSCADTPKEKKTTSPAAEQTARRSHWSVISLAPFADSINHARYQFPNSIPPWPLLSPDRPDLIADNLVAWQNPDGGWPKNVDFQRAFPAGELEKFIVSVAANDRKSTLDNRTGMTQIEYLAQAYLQYPDAVWAMSALRGLDWLLSVQHPVSGGFEGSDVRAITYNDDVMGDTLGLLTAIIQHPERYPFVGPDYKARIGTALDRGIECILKTQIVVNGKPTAWCQQHDHATLQPIWAREYEPPSITAYESVGVVRLLMGIGNPDPRVVAAVENAVQWMRDARLSGWRQIREPAPPMTLMGRFSDYEPRLAEDPAAPPIWARFYGMDGGKPLWYDRGREKKTSYNELSRERRVGYAYVGTWPKELIEIEYPVWKAKISK